MFLKMVLTFWQNLSLPECSFKERVHKAVFHERQFQAILWVDKKERLHDV